VPAQTSQRGTLSRSPAGQLAGSGAGRDVLFTAGMIDIE
jgi:hypothetical protein